MTVAGAYRSRPPVTPLIVGPFIREAGSVPGLQEDELLGEHVEQAPIGDADLRDHRQGQK